MPIGFLQTLMKNGYWVEGLEPEGISPKIWKPADTLCICEFDFQNPGTSTLAAGRPAAAANCMVKPSLKTTPANRSMEGFRM